MKTLLTLILAVVASVGFSQNILVADNNPGAPGGTHIYATLQAAIDAATAGDIIHLIPSATDYDGTGTVVVNKSISIYGIGFQPDKDGPLTAEIYRINVNASDVRISGLTIVDYVDIAQDNGSYSGITIENSYIGEVFTGTGPLANILIRGCIVNRANEGSGSVSIVFSSSVSNSVISNCILEHYGTTSSYQMITAYNGTIIKNCIFYGHDNNAFGILQNCTVSNSIFYGVVPNSTATNVFNHNTAVNYSDGSSYDMSGHTGTGNVNTPTDSTIFVDSNIVLGATNWAYTWDPSVIHPDLIDGGTDGNDIGVMGGTIPYSTTGTTLPLIKRLVAPEVIKQGDNLNATIEAQGF